MSATSVKPASRPTRDGGYLGIVAVLLAGLLVGCDGEGKSASKSGARSSPPAKPEQRLPTLTFPHEVRAAYPEVSAFLDEFLNTCLVGDYAGYRRLVSRAYTPESRERFDAIYQAIEAVTIESIEPIEILRVPPPVYRVTSTVELNSQERAQLRETHRKIAILVFREGDNWRMAPAPAEYQPGEEPPPATSSAPTTSAPSYPWDEEGDY